MDKKLKKVDKSKNLSVSDLTRQFNEKTDAMNKAYKSGNGFAVDEANKALFEFMDNVGIQKETPLYVGMKNHTWQKNHLKIIAAMSDLMQKLNRMPSNGEIHHESGLSTETIYKHLREFRNHELYRHEQDKFRFLIDRVLTTVYNLSIQGDIRACKTYLDYFTPPGRTTANHAEQNNYIQINNLQITPDELQNLPAETLQQIESLIKTPLRAVNKEESEIIIDNDTSVRVYKRKKI